MGSIPIRQIVFLSLTFTAVASVCDSLSHYPAIFSALMQNCLIRRKNLYYVKSCKKPRLLCNSQSFARLLFGSGFCSRAAYMQCSELEWSEKPVNRSGSTCNLTSRVWQNFSKCKHTFSANEKRYGLVLYRQHWATSYELWALFECGLWAAWVWRKCGCYSSAASNQVRLFYTTLR